MRARNLALLLLLTAFGCGGDASGSSRKINYGDPPSVGQQLEKGAPVAPLKMWDAAAEKQAKAQQPIDLRLAPGVNKFVPAGKPAPVQPKVDTAAAAVPAVNPTPAPNTDRVGLDQGLAQARAEDRAREPAWDYFMTIFSSQRSVTERLNANMFRHNMDLYKAEHNNHGPKSHEEMMHILETDWLMKLPDPPPGKKYVYDPKDEELYIEKK